MAKRLLSNVVGITTAILATASPAFAWKPYTHLYAANKARNELVTNNGIVLNGRVYPVRPEVLDAIKSYPAVFNGGAVGPDGMPDIAYGQAVIHPVKSGEWFKHILTDAWTRYRATGGDADSKKALAFAYGFLAHGAGDMWGHTMINDFAQGVFPAVTDILVNLLKVPPTSDNTRDLSNALRHLVSEAYVGDATPGYDGNREFGPAPGPGCPASNALCDRSDRSTPGLDMDAPHGFVYDSLISESAILPANSSGEVSRGPLIDFFRSLRSSLISAGANLGGDPLQGLRDAAGALGNIKNRVNDVYNSCHDFDLDCVGAVISFLGGSVLDIFEAGWDFVKGELEAAVQEAIKPFVSAYLGNWVADIDDGLHHWNEFGLAFSQALFDPQTRRNLQNEECKYVVGDFARDACKEGVKTMDVLMSSENDFINEHLLSMVGLPDIVGEIREFLQDAADFLRSLFCGMPVLDVVCRLVDTADAAFREFTHQIIEAAIKAVTGIDVDAIENIESNMGAFMSLEQILPPALSVSLFGPGASNGVNLFNPGDHDRIDEYLHLPPDHLEDAPEPIGGFPVPARRLKDDAELVDAQVAPVNNTIMQVKLLMLDGASLNSLLGDILVDNGIIRSRTAVHTFVDSTVPANVMFSSLQGSQPWLNLIDGDHAWRQDGLPRFCTPGSAACPPRTDSGPVSTRPATEPIGGTGQYPMWESCVLRPAFSVLYKDWENGSNTFPDLGDIVSPDTNSDDAPPQITFGIVGPSFLSGSTLFVGPTSTFSLTATDAVFTPQVVHTRFRTYLSGTTPPDYTLSTWDSSAFVLSSATEGDWTIDLGSEDPCHTFAIEPASSGTTDLMPPGFEQNIVKLDTTPPVITVQSPANTIYDSAAAPIVAATAVDLGSGLDTLRAELDATTDVTIGSALNLFNLAPGPHTVVFTAVDKVGNGSQASRDFRSLATSASLLQNLDDAWARGLIPGAFAYYSFRLTLVDAIHRHNAGDFWGERFDLNSLIEAFIAARNRGTGQECPSGTMPCRAVDPATANWFIAALAELIPNIGRASLASNGTTLGVLERLIQEYLKGNVASRAWFDELRELVTHALDQHYQLQHSAEKGTLRTFMHYIGTLLARNQTVCSSRELPCFAIDKDAAARLAAAADRVIAGVYAGSDQTITLPGTASLIGAASDDGSTTPPAGVTVNWSMVSGPGTVTFANSALLVTTATFSAAGSYTLRLTVSGGMSGSDDMVVTVYAGSPVGPVPLVNAGVDQSITLPAVASLAGTASVNGLPNPSPLPLTTMWSKFSGPGTVTFANPVALVTTASFSVAGTYTLRLAGNYSGLAGSDDVVVIVAPVPAFPCTGICTNPVDFTINARYQSGNLGTSALCYQTTSPMHDGNCDNFVSPRTLKINGVTKSCTGANWGGVPAMVNGGYCIEVTAGTYPYAYFRVW